MEGLRHGRYRMLLSNPETLRNASMLRGLETIPISHFVIDEAHCVVQWGEQFRPAYLELEHVLHAASPLRVTAFTATASPQLRSRIAARIFGDRPWSAVTANPDRPNIHYSVMRPLHTDHALTWLLRRGRADSWPRFPALPRPAIVFCPTRDESDRSARLLRLRLRDEEIRFYHAGLERAEKREIEDWFFASTDGVLCSTSAYGMGVDKSDIRSVIHRRAPDGVESYLQESGRAGRDGAPATALLLCGKEHDSTDTYTPVMQGYVETRECRRQYLLREMGALGDCTGCDRCDGAVDPNEIEARLLAGIIRRPFPMDLDFLPERVGLEGRRRGVHLPPWHRRDLASLAKRRRRRAYTRKKRRMRRTTAST